MKINWRTDSQESLERVQEELGKKIDLTGQRFGKPVVVKFEGKNKHGHSLWECLCDCGKSKSLTTSNLNGGKTISCGCAKYKDIKGKTIHKWKVLSLCEDTLGSGYLYWNCKCECGTERRVASDGLLKGRSKNCGCDRKTGSVVDLTGQIFGKRKVLRESPIRDTTGQIQWECECECGSVDLVRTSGLISGTADSCYTCSRMADISGKRYGKLTVLKPDGTASGKVKWLCKCDCGGFTSVTKGNLDKAISADCGCTVRRDILGEKFNRLLVMKNLGICERTGSYLWECKCECGNIKNLPTGTIVSGNTKSCGCINIEKTKARSGVNSPRYNPNLTDEDRLNNRYLLNGKSISQWRLKVYRMDRWICQMCDKHARKLNSHHLNAWNAFPEQRFDTANGITLCSDCHKEFHHFNGYGDNTLEQFRDHIACTVGEEYVSEIEETLLSRESEIIGQEEPTRKLQTT